MSGAKTAINILTIRVRTIDLETASCGIDAGTVHSYGSRVRLALLFVLLCHRILRSSIGTDCCCGVLLWTRRLYTCSRDGAAAGIHASSSRFPANFLAKNSAGLRRPQFFALDVRSWPVSDHQPMGVSRPGSTTFGSAIQTGESRV
jgi:hypothetical protein